MSEAVVLAIFVRAQKLLRYDDDACALNTEATWHVRRVANVEPAQNFFKDLSIARQSRKSPPPSFFITRRTEEAKTKAKDELPTQRPKKITSL